MGDGQRADALVCRLHRLLDGTAGLGVGDIAGYAVCQHPGTCWICLTCDGFLDCGCVCVCLGEFAFEIHGDDGGADTLAGFEIAEVGQGMGE
jgi:hypothetical protein